MSRPLGVQTGLVTGQRPHGTNGESSRITMPLDWPDGTDEILLEGLADTQTAFDQAHDRMCLLHPRLKRQAIGRRLRAKPQEEGLTWTTALFWKQEIDFTLIGGILAGAQGKEAAIRTVQKLWPRLALEVLRQRLEALADQGTPSWAKPPFWKGPLKDILQQGVKGGIEAERRAINKVLRLYPELRPGVVMAQLRRVRFEIQRAKGRQRRRFLWTDELLHELKEACDALGVTGGVTQIQERTGWPRDAILRKAHLTLELPWATRSIKAWSASERRYVIENAGHVSVPAMAKELSRSVESIACKMKYLGLSTAREEGFTISKLAAEWHVRRATIRQWIALGWMKRGKDGRVPERSVRSFCRQYADKLNWDKMETHVRAWVLEFSGAGDDDDREESSGAAVG